MHICFAVTSCHSAEKMILCVLLSFCVLLPHHLLNLILFHIYSMKVNGKKSGRKLLLGSVQRWWATKIQTGSQNCYHVEKDRQNSWEKSINCFPGAEIWLSRESKACFSEFTIELLFLIGGVSRDLF